MSKLLILAIFLLLSGVACNGEINRQERENMEKTVLKMAKAIQTNNIEEYLKTLNMEALKSSCKEVSQAKTEEQHIYEECVSEKERNIRGKFTIATEKKLIPGSAGFEITGMNLERNYISTRVKISYAAKNDAFRTDEGRICKEAVVKIHYNKSEKFFLPLETASVTVLSEYK